LFNSGFGFLLFEFGLDLCCSIYGDEDEMKLMFANLWQTKKLVEATLLPNLFNLFSQGLQPTMKNPNPEFIELFMIFV
jgi:hypothetical protein